ncbi:ribosomal protein L4/L1e [Naegleria gruberi]|uniref:Large ribosomal subunit protein uL4m n=1 Tax=Naegleria gruberi TaxID=5762 RepID=D2VLH2_NAEGR|nr:ribosomal protein L4/L1e [Naegleria gruberi]EFC42312.1 ribosomal protein L4/L1e [Naegleria gruberi]|eukprot:XP_002675056.1 ribosomal protein L4/L1e [Naegleria gruberi strain NEG-M]
MLRKALSSSSVHQQHNSLWLSLAIKNKGVFSSSTCYHTSAQNSEALAKHHINTHVIKPNKYKFPLINPEQINKLALEKALSKNVASGTRVVMDASKAAVPKFEIQPEAMVKNLKTGEFTEMINLHPYFFNCTPRKDILYLMVKWQLAKRRQGTHKTKYRLETAYCKQKQTPQKGRGAARHSDRGAPQYRGGGHAMALRPRSYEYNLNKKIRRLALRMALTTKYQQGKLIIVDDFSIDTFKTKYVAGLISNTVFPDSETHEKEIKDRGVLLIDGEQVNANFERGVFNLHYADYLSIDGLNVYDMLRREKVVISKSGLETLTKKYAKYIKLEFY